MTALGTLVPGTGLIVAGRRRIGGFLLFLFIMAVAIALAAVALVPTQRLLSYGGDRQMLLIVGSGLAAAAMIWLIVALVTHRLLEPDGLPAGKRFGGALLVITTASLAIAPLSLAANNVLTQRDLIGALSGGRSHTTPEIANVQDPWADMSRLNLLLLGSDAGDGRDGVRPDTLIVASVDTETGDTTTISIPRNLQRFPFPPDSPLAEQYPQGFTGAGEQTEWMINAVFRNVPAAHPEVFEDVDNPGADATKWAVEGALGIDIDYFAIVNLDGFQAIVDALGGVTLDVPRDIPVGNRELPGRQGCTEARDYIRAGDDQHLNGAQALWFARSRCGSDDYDRMARQQCVLGAIVDKVDPATVVTKYQSLASATRDLIQTDIPEDLFPPLIELAVDVQNATLESLTLDRKFFEAMGGATPANPDYDELHTRIAQILEPAGDKEDEAGDHVTDTAPADPSGPPNGESGDGTEESTHDDTGSEDGDATTGTAQNAETQPDEPETDPDEDQADDEPVETDAVC
ncbi:LytR family transcriptional regulator [Actinobacteria bacterium YIM 96077]|uniref:LytR family transcriptional regulator n=1 Tax=Phytoactinopolyspora halophila TaxID=1981511 RepID=A0A329QBS7_9ACTN|nr:LCP family protein [Phytoactinopolyspora halophila]AYY11839.1 LytR family transcriptional regulator [Actinobacteria bacterium YIM 96077]RAW09860.1 LytR family transcriptional regulator [Phytoactinopolyspora halophila]